MAKSATIVALLSLLAGCLNVQAQEVSQELANATAELATTTYELAYQFKPGEVVRYQVEHLATVDTTMSGERQTTKSRSNSTKLWKVQEATADRITFSHSVEHVAMSQETTGSDPISYDSRKDEQIPDEYQKVAETLGKTLATVTINAQGTVIKRESGSASPDLGFGGLVVPLPKGAIELGHTWRVPKTVKLKESDGRIKPVKTQLRYRLEKVRTGVATISVKTQVLTPIHDAKLKSQLVQRISAGEIKFDIDAGRVLSRRMDWDENVIGFNGPSSNMKYLARFTEKIGDTEVARR